MLVSFRVKPSNMANNYENIIDDLERSGEVEEDDLDSAERWKRRCSKASCRRPISHHEGGTGANCTMEELDEDGLKEYERKLLERMRKEKREREIEKSRKKKETAGKSGEKRKEKRNDDGNLEDQVTKIVGKALANINFPMHSANMFAGVQGGEEEGTGPINSSGANTMGQFQG